MKAYFMKRWIGFIRHEYDKEYNNANVERMNSTNAPAKEDIGTTVLGMCGVLWLHADVLCYWALCLLKRGDVAVITDDSATFIGEKVVHEYLLCIGELVICHDLYGALNGV